MQKKTDIELKADQDKLFQNYTETKKKIGDRREGGASLRAISPEHSQNANLWKRKDESQDDLRSRYRNETDAGYLRKVEKKWQKKGGFEGRIVIDPSDPENPHSGLSKRFIGHFLINNVSSDLYQIDRQRRGLERLQELEASSYNLVHEWLFDISKAHNGLEALPELAHQPLARLNAEQELLNSQVTLVTARRDAYVAGFAVLAAMGRAEAKDCFNSVFIEAKRVLMMSSMPSVLTNLVRNSGILMVMVWHQVRTLPF